MENLKKNVEMASIKYNMAISETLKILMPMALTVHDGGKLFNKLVELKKMLVDDPNNNASSCEAYI